jgi:hypothetical protein
MNVSVKKTGALVCALQKLHNFCIDTESNMDVPMPTPANEWEIEMGGGIPLVPAPGAQSIRDMIPDQLLDAVIILTILNTEVTIINHRDGILTI